MPSPAKMKTIHSAARNDRACACAGPYSVLPDYTSWGPITTLLVGRYRTPLAAHTGLLTQASPVFRAALATHPTTGAPTWREGTTLTYFLTAEDPDTIAACLSWLYTRRLWPLSADPDVLPHHLVPLSWETLTAAAVFATLYEMHGLHNAVVSAMVDAVIQRWDDGDRPTHLLAEVYASVPAGAPLRTLFLHVALLEDRDWLLEHEEDDNKLPVDFWVDVEKYDKLAPEMRRVQKEEQKRQEVTDTTRVLFGGGNGPRDVYDELQGAFPRPADMHAAEDEDEDDVRSKPPGELLLLETREDWMNMSVCGYLHVENEGPEAYVRRKEEEREELDAYSMRLSAIEPAKYDIVIEGEYDENGLRRLVGIWQHVRNLRSARP